MATCKYCGQSAGFFSRVHKECEEKHEKGIQGMSGMLRKYFSGAMTAQDMGAKIQRNRLPYYLSDEDIADVAASVITDYASTLHRPYTQQMLSKIKDFLANIGVPYALINKNGALDKLGQKLFQGFAVEYFAQGLPMSQVSINTASVTSVLPLSSQKKDEAYMNVLNKAASNFMKGGMLTDNEERLITSYANSIGLSLNCLPAQYATEDLAKIGQAIVLKDLSQGKLPQQPLTVPVMLGKGECALWVYDNVTLYQEKFQREYQGRSGGFSYRICKGVTYRTNQFKGHPVERSFMNNVGTGSLVITNKNLIFHCPTASVKIPFNKLIGVTPYSDGLEVHKDEAKPKRTVFQGFDSWFVMNVLNQVTV
jgi:hypothetical protein